VEVLRFRQVQTAIERARAEAGAGNLGEARRAYERAIAASPDSAFLHRELGAVERRAGNTDAALDRFTRAAELEPLDVESLTAIGELHEARGDDTAAHDAFERAFGVDPTPELAARIAAADERRRDADLPAEFRAIAEAPQITRAHLAALAGVRFDDLLRAAPARQVVMTDTRGHWAEPWIQMVASAGVLELFENYAFHPDAAVRRVDLAELVRRLAMLADPGHPQLDLPPDRRPVIDDVTARHLNYPAVAFAVASSLMPLLEGGRFDVSRAVSGPEAAEVLARLRRLVAGGR
jgi:tetratricopeptide (TPR) repeat protein